MWWKCPLLIVLSLPLGYRAWREVNSPSGPPAPQLNLSPREELTRKKSAVQELRGKLNARGLDEDLTGSVFRIADTPPRPSVRPRSFEALASAQVDHAASIGDVREFARIYAELESDVARPVPVRDEELKRWLEERRSLTRRRMDREKALDAEFNALMEQAQPALRTRDAPRLEQAVGNFDSDLARLGRHRADCEGMPMLASRAERRLAEWRGLRDLLGLAREDTAVINTGERADVIRHVGRYGSLSQAASDRLKAEVRIQLARFCDDYLPRRLEPDDKVIYRGHPVVRDRVWVRWKPGSPEANRFGEESRFSRLPGMDEFSPPDPRSVEHYFRRIGEGDDTSHEQVRPTVFNQAARYFNERRPSLRWNAVSLRTLLDGCPVRWASEEAMPLPYRRAGHLLAAMTAQPALFPGGE